MPSKVEERVHSFGTRRLYEPPACRRRISSMLRDQNGDPSWLTCTLLRSIRSCSLTSSAYESSVGKSSFNLKGESRARIGTSVHRFAREGQHFVIENRARPGHQYATD